MTPLWTSASASFWVEMRMGVLVGHAAVGRPAGVADANAAPRRIVPDQFRKIVNATDALADFDSAMGDRGDPGRVVSAVLETAQTVEKDGDSFSFSDVSTIPHIKLVIG